MRAHIFDSTGEAYDATQCDQNIKNGDVFLIPSEKVVGVAYTWPFAVSKEHGKLHYPMEDIVEFSKSFRKEEEANIVSGIENAKKVCEQLGW